MIDPLKAMLLFQVPEEPLDARAREELSTRSEEFLRGGGVITPEFWERIDKESRAALVAANNRIRLEFACLIGRATASGDGALTMYSAIDGGDALAEAAVSAATRRMLANISKLKVG